MGLEGSRFGSRARVEGGPKNGCDKMDIRKCFGTESSKCCHMTSSDVSKNDEQATLDEAAVPLWHNMKGPPDGHLDLYEIITFKCQCPIIDVAHGKG